WVRNNDTIMVPDSLEYISFSARGYLDSKLPIRRARDGREIVQVQLPQTRNAFARQRASALDIKATGYNLRLETEPGNTLSINGEPVDGHLYLARLDNTTNRVVASHPRKGKRKVTVNSEFNTMEYHALWLNPTPLEFTTRAIVPGVFQMYNGERVKGLFFLTTTVTSAAAAYHFHSQINSQRIDYRWAREDYRSRVMWTPDMVTELDAHRGRYQTSRSLARIFAGAAVAMYVTSLIDAATMIDFKFAKPSSRVDPFAGIDAESGSLSAGINVRF
ncbi:MAG: hypothetical protein LAT57_13405, partial [Balneolales bacterium]|nr:hypothetical protein [Balneolales bacterium]